MRDLGPKPSKSDRTRSAILSAAREAFAEAEFEGATIRDIARRAGADPALVMRYFENKEGLFARATAFDLQLPDLRDVSIDDLGATLVAHFLDLWEDEISGGALTILLRSATSSREAADRVREIFSEQVEVRLEARRSGRVRHSRSARRKPIARLRVVPLCSAPPARRGHAARARDCGARAGGAKVSSRAVIGALRHDGSSSAGRAADYSPLRPARNGSSSARTFSKRELLASRLVAAAWSRQPLHIELARDRLLEIARGRERAVLDRRGRCRSSTNSVARGAHRGRRLDADAPAFAAELVALRELDSAR